MKRAFIVTVQYPHRYESKCIPTHLRALAGLQGFSKENTTYNGPEFPLEMMIFSGTDSAKMHTFLDDYRQTGAQPVPLKAIITPHNIFWTVETLFNELKKEYLHFNR